MITAEGKTQEKLKAQARDAYLKYLEAQKPQR